jgi:catechol 2,3-dioxygenase-like lactoylglutathione lyase family enzyme
MSSSEIENRANAAADLVAAQQTRNDENEVRVQPDVLPSRHPQKGTKTGWAVVGARHAGITVSDLDRSLRFYCEQLGLDLLWRRLYEEPELRDIVGVPKATAFDIAMVGIPGDDLTIELIDYKGCTRRSGATSPADYGTGHFCLFVDGIDELYADLLGRGVTFRSEGGPVEMTAGPNRGGKSLYSLDPDGYIIELHQPPTRPHTRT